MEQRSKRTFNLARSSNGVLHLSSSQGRTRNTLPFSPVILRIVADEHFKQLQLPLQQPNVIRFDRIEGLDGNNYILLHCVEVTELTCIE